MPSWNAVGPFLQASATLTEGPWGPLVSAVLGFCVFWGEAPDRVSNQVLAAVASIEMSFAKSNFPTPTSRLYLLTFPFVPSRSYSLLLALPGSSWPSLLPAGSCPCFI